MLILKYLILGIIQGFTEPLPISSSGHLRIFKSLFNSEVLSDMNFEIVVNFGSLIAILILYRKEIASIIKDFFMFIKTKEKKYSVNYKYAWLIVVGTIPAALLGLFVKDFIEEYFTTKLVGLMLIVTSILLFMIKDIKGKKEKKDMTYLDALKIGLFQVVALLPGISRSGATVVGGMKSNLTRETALNYSFMLYIPISVALSIRNCFCAAWAIPRTLCRRKCTPSRTRATAPLRSNPKARRARRAACWRIISMPTRCPAKCTT